MNRTIKLNHYSCGMTVEIYDKPLDYLLTPETKPCYLARAELIP